MRTFLLLLGLWVLTLGQVFAQRASISGFVRDAMSGETLIMANVVLGGTTIGAATNHAGYYTLTNLAPGAYTVVASYIGYADHYEEVTLQPGQRLRLDIDLTPEALVTDEIVVSAERDHLEETKNISVSQLKVASIKELPTVLEPDVFRSLQLLPGVKAASDYSSGLYIRGGSPDQTLILLDRNPVYNPSHFFGFFSAFNPDAIKDVRLYKGAYPAEYGGRLGSVVDIYNKDGNRRSYGGGLSLGLLASRAYFEGPVDNGSVILAVRRSTMEPLLAALRNGDVEGIPDLFYFYDLNGKINYDASPNDKLSFAFYTGNDRLDLDFLEDGRFEIALGNRTLSTNWTHIFSQNLFSNFTLTSSRYHSQPVFVFAGTSFERRNRIFDTSLKGDFEYIPGERHTLKTGFWAGNFTMSLEDLFDARTTLDERLQTAYASLYVQETYKPGSKWIVQGGVRANYFSEGEYVRLEPRLSLEYRPIERLRLQSAYGRYYQFLTLISSELFSAFDLWLTTDDGVPPAFGDQMVFGAKSSLGHDVYLDLETYYRTMNDLFELDPFLFDAAGADYPDLFRFGQGYAYGIEAQLEKNRGRINGFVGYTYGKTRRRFPNINDFKYYAPKYDRTHDLNVLLNYSLARRWRLTSVFTYATGQAYTEPAGRFRLVDYPLANDDLDGLISRYNQARLPAYHRLDLGLTHTGRLFGIADYELQLQVINAYKRRNIWFYFFEFENDGTIERHEAPQIPVPIPNVSFSLTF